jgi:hypothetical protein
MQEFKNSSANHLGMPLPKGCVRFYRRDDKGQLDFTGENDIDHTPKDETIRRHAGNAFDMIGERSRTNYRADFNARWLDESFEIKVRNHKSEPVESVSSSLSIAGRIGRFIKNSDPFKKLDGRPMEFPVRIPSAAKAGRAPFATNRPVKRTGFESCVVAHKLWRLGLFCENTQ